MSENPEPPATSPSASATLLILAIGWLNVGGAIAAFIFNAAAFALALLVIGLGNFLHARGERKKHGPFEQPFKTILVLSDCLLAALLLFIVLLIALGWNTAIP